jgi:hypothetical protein
MKITGRTHFYFPHSFNSILNGRSDKIESLITEVQSIFYTNNPMFILNSSHGRSSDYPEPPAQSRTRSFPASGSSVVLAVAQTLTVARSKVQ